MIREADMRTEQLPSANGQGVIVSVPIDLIDPHPQQPRQDFSAEELQALATSMQCDDLMQRPVVRAMPNGRYQLVAGERRCRAAKLAGWTNMPVVVRELSDLEALKLLGVENLLRKDWGPVEIGRYLATLCKPIEEGGAGMTQERAAQVFGRPKTWGNLHVCLLRLPEVWLTRIGEGEIGIHHVKQMFPYLDQPGLMKAFDDDYRKSPWAWGTQMDFKRNVELIAQQRRRGKRPQLREEGEPQKPARGPAPRPLAETPDRAVQSMAATMKQEAEAQCQAKPLLKINTKRICNVLRPYMHDREMLVAIRDTADKLIRELHEVPA